MTPYEIYDDVPCPRCGYTECRDDGPYDYIPWLDDPLGGAPDPKVHLLWCGRCGKPFDAGPPEPSGLYRLRCDDHYHEYTAAELEEINRDPSRWRCDFGAAP